MSQYVLFAILGIGVGSIYAGLATGIVLTYQGSGVINFAAAAMATVPLYVFNELQAGRLTLPLPWVPSIELSLPTPAAIAVALIVAGALGALVDVVASRPLRAAPVLAKVVVAVGVMVTLQAAVALKYGTELRLLDTVLPSGTIEIAGFPVPVDRLWLSAVVVLLSAVLALWFARSCTGPAIGILTPGNLTLLVVPALAVALIARLSSLWAALAGALGLGVLQSELLF